MNKILEIKLSGWTSTPRMPFIISGNALCLPVPPYSTILGVIGCCVGRNIMANEVKVGYRYSYDITAVDLETRGRLKFKNKKIISLDKDTEANKCECHVKSKVRI